MTMDSRAGDSLEAAHASGLRGFLGPSRARLRRVLLNSSAALAAKGVSFLATLALFPLLIAYLGTPRFAVWLAVSSLTQLLSWTDLGLGNATVTRIARHGTGTEAIRRTISCAYVCIAAVGVLVGLALAILWSSGIFVAIVASAQAPPDARPLFAIGLAAFALWLPAALSSSIETGLRMSRVASLCQAASTLTVAVLTYFAVRQERPLAHLIAIACFTPVAFQVANSALLLAVRGDLRPRLSLVTWAESRELLRLGGLFLGLQLGVLALTGADTVIVLRQAGPVQAVDYAAVAKLFGVLSVLGATLFSPLWPEYGAAHARGEMAWVRRTYMRSLLAALAIGVAGAVVLAALSATLFRWWLGPAVQPSSALVLLAATWLVLDLSSQATAMVLNGMAVMRPQIVTSIVFGAACLPLKWEAAARFGAVGLYGATLVCFVAAVVLPYAFILPRLLRRAP